MSTEIKHSFEGPPIFRMLDTGTDRPLDLDLTLVTDTATTYLPDLYDGYVYISNTPYEIKGLIKVGIRKGISTNNSTLSDNECLLCYGEWILRHIDGYNFNTTSYINQSVNIIWAKHNGVTMSIFNNYPLTIINGVDIKSLDMYLSFNITDVVNYLNTTYSLGIDNTTALDVYLLISIDNYHGVLLHAGSNP